MSSTMINFTSIDVKTFLTDYWQKKPCILRQALPNFINPLTPDELAGLALEDDVESRLVFETPNNAPYWQLKTGPFVETDFESLPKTHWTLLVQGVDRCVPEVTSMLDHFDFIPQWRVDDVMISYAPKHGSVGPHYDNYDVFLYQAVGRRQWSLTTKHCNPTNCLQDVELRIMHTFEVEDTFILSPGDMLYLPPHIGHHGISLTDDCMTYSFGYRSYHGQELWDSFGDYLSEKSTDTGLYQDPNWAQLNATSAIPATASLNAKKIMQDMLNNDTQLQNWFGCFATRLDLQAEQDMPIPLTDEEAGNIASFILELQQHEGLVRDATCRIAYNETPFTLFINGCEWNLINVNPLLVKQVANHRQLTTDDLMPFLNDQHNQTFIYELWQLQWLQWRMYS